MTVEQYVEEYQGKERQILEYFDALCVNKFGLTSKIRFKIPFYYNLSWICYLNPVKGGKIELAFLRGNEMNQSQQFLSSKDRKQVYGIEFSSLKDIDEEIVNLCLIEAIELDINKPYQSKRKSKK